MRWPVLQTSANRAGGRDPRRLEDVPQLIREAADLVIDGGELPGTPSTVVDLRRYEETGEGSIVRVGAVGADEVNRALPGQFHFHPSTYLDMMRAEDPEVARRQDDPAA